MLRRPRGRVERGLERVGRNSRRLGARRLGAREARRFGPRRRRRSVTAKSIKIKPITIIMSPTATSNPATGETLSSGHDI
ncbi:MAG: Uncharacterised protein [Cellulomonadaceae bacterium TMED98]|nr:MAG: Uncharacterised protein [Cellulomonadaceae bacterium TMED98]